MINRHFGLSLLASVVVGAGWWLLTRDPFVVTMSVVLGSALALKLPLEKRSFNMRVYLPMGAGFLAALLQIPLRRLIHL
ncbi:MAG TPA: hypothetical protein VL332_05505 [Candidatus Saccharimonadaceae bacterium]|jgi:hypothetical protein|nr:hypothetical protein [Candidatus Saccharimonadaceae bacterium]